MQQVADITFRGTDFTYVGARSFEEGLEKAKKEKPAIILVDATLPGKGGYDLCLALKSEGATANAPVVILVGNSAPYDANRGTQVGADANLPKPWDTQTMLDKVTEIVGKASGGVAKPGQAAAAGGATATAATPTPAPATTPPATKQPAKEAAAQPPRSSTIMGMPTIKMPPGVAPTVTPQAEPAMEAPAGNNKAPATAATAAAATKAAPPGPATSVSTSSASSAAPALALSGTNRAPMISGSPTKRSALVEATLNKMAARLSEATGLAPGSPELLALLKLSAEVVERVVWEVVPDLAEQIIRENLQDLTARRGSS
jgi:CheY-like chemotaxis protein